MLGEPIRTYVIDRSATTRELLGEALEQLTNASIVGDAEDHHYAIERLAEVEPHVIICDRVAPDVHAETFRDAAAQVDARLVLYCGLPPNLAPDRLSWLGFERVVLKNFDGFAELISVISLLQR